jgi:tetrapyrrole methylase family protein / MazG family protein
MNSPTDVQKELQELITLIQKLRAPNGCPWDQKQTKQDIGKYILDEAYEVLDSLIENNPQHIQEELGDLLFQILFIAEISSESGEFSLADVIAAIKEKMIRRHPHVFGNVLVNSVREVKENWQEIKKQERGGKATEANLFGNIPRSLPELKRAQKITAVAAQNGFDWKATPDVLEKLQEELREFNTALNNNDQSKIEEELGDLLFTLVNLSRFVQVDSETALAKTTNKFLQRFAYITDQLASLGKTPRQATFPEMDALWEKSKKNGI